MYNNRGDVTSDTECKGKVLGIQLEWTLEEPWTQVFVPKGESMATIVWNFFSRTVAKSDWKDLWDHVISTHHADEISSTRRSRSVTRLQFDIGKFYRIIMENTITRKHRGMFRVDVAMEESSATGKNQRSGSKEPNEGSYQLLVYDDPRATGPTILGPAQWSVRESAFDHIPNDTSSLLPPRVLVRVSPTPCWMSREMGVLPTLHVTVGSASDRSENPRPAKRRRKEPVADDRSRDHSVVSTEETLHSPSGKSERLETERREDEVARNEDDETDNNHNEEVDNESHMEVDNETPVAAMEVSGELSTTRPSTRPTSAKGETRFTTVNGEDSTRRESKESSSSSLSGSSSSSSSSSDSTKSSSSQHKATGKKPANGKKLRSSASSASSGANKSKSRTGSTGTDAAAEAAPQAETRLTPAESHPEASPTALPLETNVTASTELPRETEQTAESAAAVGTQPTSADPPPQVEVAESTRSSKETKTADKLGEDPGKPTADAAQQIAGTHDAKQTEDKELSKVDNESNAKEANNLEIAEDSIHTKNSNPTGQSSVEVDGKQKPPQGKEDAAPNHNAKSAPTSSSSSSGSSSSSRSSGSSSSGSSGSSSSSSSSAVESTRKPSDDVPKKKDAAPDEAATEEALSPPKLIIVQRPSTEVAQPTDKTLTTPSHPAPSENTEGHETRPKSLPESTIPPREKGKHGPTNIRPDSPSGSSSSSSSSTGSPSSSSSTVTSSERSAKKASTPSQLATITKEQSNKTDDSALGENEKGHRDKASSSKAAAKDKSELTPAPRIMDVQPSLQGSEKQDKPTELQSPDNLPMDTDTKGVDVDIPSEQRTCHKKTNAEEETIEKSQVAATANIDNDPPLNEPSPVVAKTLQFLSQPELDDAESATATNDRQSGKTIGKAKQPETEEQNEPDDSPHLLDTDDAPMLDPVEDPDPGASEAPNSDSSTQSSLKLKTPAPASKTLKSKSVRNTATQPKATQSQRATRSRALVGAASAIPVRERSTRSARRSLPSATAKTPLLDRSRKINLRRARKSNKGPF